MLGREVDRDLSEVGDSAVKINDFVFRALVRATAQTKAETCRAPRGPSNIWPFLPIESWLAKTPYPAWWRGSDASASDGDGAGNLPTGDDKGPSTMVG